jgi:hypothetical protein
MGDVDPRWDELGIIKYAFVKGMLPVQPVQKILLSCP